MFVQLSIDQLKPVSFKHPNLRHKFAAVGVIVAVDAFVAVVVFLVAVDVIVTGAVDVLVAVTFLWL